MDEHVVRHNVRGEAALAKSQSMYGAVSLATQSLGLPAVGGAPPQPIPNLGEIDFAHVATEWLLSAMTLYSAWFEYLQGMITAQEVLVSQAQQAWEHEWDVALKDHQDKKPAAIRDAYVRDEERVIYAKTQLETATNIYRALKRQWDRVTHDRFSVSQIYNSRMKQQRDTYVPMGSAGHQSLGTHVHQPTGALFPTTKAPPPTGPPTRPSNERS